MIIEPIQIAGSFMFLCILLLLGTIYSRIHWTIKSSLVVSSLLFCIFTYNAYENALGYPIKATPPSPFQLLWGITREPATSQHDPGAIYLWITDPKGRIEPRSIELPFSKQNRDVIAKAKKKIEAGEKVFMSMKAGDKKDLKGEGDGTNQGSQGRAPGAHPGNGTSVGDNKLPYFLRDEVLDFTPPPDTIPQKTGDNPE